MWQNFAKSVVPHLPKIAKFVASVRHIWRIVRQIFAKCAANMQRFFFNYVGLFVLESCSNITTWGKFIITNCFYIRTIQ